MHLKSFASDMSITAVLLLRLVTGTRLVLLLPSLFGIQLSKCTSVHGLMSIMALSSGSGIAISWSSSSCASASKCDTINWPEWMVSRSLDRCTPAWLWLKPKPDDDDGGGEGLFEPVNQLSRSNCCWWDILLAIVIFVFDGSVTLDPGNRKVNVYISEYDNELSILAILAQIINSPHI